MARPASPTADWPTALALIVAAAFPSLLTWSYLFLLPAVSASHDLCQLVYGVGKLVQFAIPLLFVWMWEHDRPLPTRPRLAGVALGFAFGLAVAAGIFAMYFGWLRDSPLLGGVPGLVRKVLEGFGVASGPRFFAVAVFYVAAHSLFEEYYYRWFVFGRMRLFLSLWPAILLSSLVFMAHHILVLSAFLPDQFWTAVLPLSLCVAVGGGVWAWLYAQTRSLYAPWLSHALVDAALFAIGWNLLHRGG